ncbi:MAG: glycosyltransferase family 2 protein [Acidimicrobiia bacterium]
MTAPHCAPTNANGARPSVGVIVPVHNGARYLGEALGSLVEQSEPAQQVVVVDDGSTDDSLAIARSFQERLPLEIIRLGGRSGVSAARNAGVARLRTPLVGFLDADDVWYPQHLARTVDAYLRRGGLISPGALIWYPDGSTRSFHRWLGMRTPRDGRQLESLLRQNFVFVGALLPRADFLAVGGFRPFAVGEDWDLWIRLLARGLRVTQLEEPTVLYRRHGANTTSRRVTMLPPILELLEHAERELASRYEPAVRRSIAQHRAELALERHLATAERRRPSWRVIRSGWRGRSRIRAKAVVFGLAPALARRISPTERDPGTTDR